MASVNKVIVVGNLGRDPETRFLPDGKAVCNFSVATTDTWKDKVSGEKRRRPNGTACRASAGSRKSAAST